jgi:hypothetical protein
MYPFSEFKQASHDYWIPYTVDDKDKSVVGFSHKEYTQLVFSSPPTRWTLKKRFNEIVYDDRKPGITFIENLWRKSSKIERDLFYKNFIIELEKSKVSNERRGSIVDIFYRSDSIAARAKIYIDLLNKLNLEKPIDLPKSDKANKTSFIEPAIWNGSQVELVELIDSLYNSGKLPGVTQQQLIDCFNLIFSTDLNYDQFADARQAIKKRNEITKFLNWLSKNYKTKMNEK